MWFEVAESWARPARGDQGQGPGAGPGRPVLGPSADFSGDWLWHRQVRSAADDDAMMTSEEYAAKHGVKVVIVSGEGGAGEWRAGAGVPRARG